LVQVRIRLPSPHTRESFPFERRFERFKVVGEFVFPALAKVEVDVLQTSRTPSGMPALLDELEVAISSLTGVFQKRPFRVRYSDAKHAPNGKNSVTFSKESARDVGIFDVLQKVFRVNERAGTIGKGELFAKVKCEVGRVRQIDVDEPGFDIGTAAKVQLETGRIAVSPCFAHPPPVHPQGSYFRTKRLKRLPRSLIEPTEYQLLKQSTAIL
jgi:hypothetical protein